MNFVEPIRDVKKIAQIKNMLRGSGKIRELLLFELGINSALRISDLLKVRVGDLYESDGSIKNYFEIKEEKTNKLNRITITPKVKMTLLEYASKYSGIVSVQKNYVFFHTKKKQVGFEPIGRKQAWQMISQWCSDVGLKGNYGGHTLRKTRGYQARIQGISLSIIQHKLQHSSLAVTMRYLGITYDEIEEACNRLDL